MADQVITTSLTKCENADGRGKHFKNNKLSDTVVNNTREHIFSYHPSVSHYRRAHAPRRLYLPPELKINDMYNDYKAEKYPKLIVSYETYRKWIRYYNIGFVKLGEEECEACEEHKQHLGECDGDPCNVCDAHEEHLRLAKLGRECYQKDREENEHDVEDTLYLSSDMQKVIMLPRIPGYKTAVFTRRLTVYHQTFFSYWKGKKHFRCYMART